MLRDYHNYAQNMYRQITGFRQDANADWIAELVCGHTQHVRHNPPWTMRPWVVTAEGRAAHIGSLLFCPLCEAAGEPDRVK
jgi:hypothetical protein